MATTIKLKNSVTTTNTPTSLAQGEVAINITDKKVWVGNAATTPIQLLGAGGSASFSSLTCTSLTNSGLTSGRVTYAGTGGLLQDSANLTFNGTKLTTSGIINSALTSGRVTYATTNGELTDSANLTFNGTTLTAVNTINVPNTFGFKNRIINGAMVIDQRNAGASVTVNDETVYTVDRWSGTDVTDGAFTVQRDTSAPAGFINSIKITTTTADGSLAATQAAQIRQEIEGFNTADLMWGTANAKTVTLSFWVRSSLTGTFGGSLRNDGLNRSYPFSYTISVADTWEYKTVTIAGDTSGTWLTDNGVGIRVTFGLGAGADRSGTAGAWNSNNNVAPTGAVSVIGTLNATWYITGVQLEVGSTATSFDYRPYGTELALCQRYYEIVGTGATGAWRSSTGTSMGLVYKVTKRGTPTSSAFTSSVSILDPATAVRTTSSFSIATPDAINTTGAGIDFNGFTGATAQRVAVCYTDCVAISAEL